MSLKDTIKEMEAVAARQRAECEADSLVAQERSGSSGVYEVSGVEYKLLRELEEAATVFDRQRLHDLVIKLSSFRRARGW